MDDNSSIKSDTINISEKLDNSTNSDLVPEVPREIIYPNELNNFLREQLRYYVQKNGMLQQNLVDLEARYTESKENLDKLEEKLSSYERFGDKTKFVSSSQVATSKIVELCKKLREKNSEVETLKTKCSRIEKYTSDLKKQIESDNQLNVKEPAPQETPPNSFTEEEIRRQNEKVTTLTNKLIETNNQNLLLKNELKLAKKVIHQETGEMFETLQNSHNSNGWRGRAQQILDLQQKNLDLKEKLKMTQSNNPVEIVPVTPSKLDGQLAALSKEYDEIKKQLEELKKKHETLKARHKVIDIDYTLLKSKAAMLKEQATRDQEVITTLLGQLNSSKENRNDMISQKERSITKLQTDKKQLMIEIEEYKLVIKKLREELKEKDNGKEKSNVISSVYKKDEICKVAGEEKFLELIDSLNQKLKTERETHAKTQSLLRAEKQKVIKGEAALARLELETTTRSTYSSTSSTRCLDSSLKDQLELAEEHLKALQTRLEIEQMERKNDMQQFGQILKSYELKKQTESVDHTRAE